MAKASHSNILINRFLVHPFAGHKILQKISSPKSPPILSEILIKLKNAKEIKFAGRIVSIFGTSAGEIIKFFRSDYNLFLAIVSPEEVPKNMNSTSC